jgi:hypothetical protein
MIYLIYLELFGDVMLLNLVSLMHMTVVVMFPGYGGYQIATLPSNCSTTYSTTCYYTGTSTYYTEKAEYYTRTYATPGPVYYTEEPKHYSAPRYHQTEAPVNYTTNASECYMIIYAALNYYTGASKCNTINVQPICKKG